MVVVVVALLMRVFRNSREKKKAFCEAVVQKEKEDIFCDVFWEFSNRRQKTIIRVFSRVRARRDSKNSVVVISKATEYYDI